MKKHKNEKLIKAQVPMHDAPPAQPVCATDTFTRLSVAICINDRPSSTANAAGVGAAAAASRHWHYLCYKLMLCFLIIQSAS